MENLRYTVFAVFCVLYVVQGAIINFDEERVERVKTESDLRQDLFRNYDKLVRPVRNAATTVPAWVSITPLYLTDMDETRGMMVLDTFFLMKWKDEYLQWDPAKYSGISILNLPLSEVWKPDFTVYTASPDNKFLPTIPTQVLINNTGEVMWVPPFTINSKCPLQPSKSPRKIIECNIKIGSWTYSGKVLDIQKFSEEVDLTNFQDTHPDWQLVSVKSSRESKFYPCCPEAYPLLHFNVTLKRRPSSYKSENFPLTTLF